MAQKSPYQTLVGLKKKSYYLWCSLNEIEDELGDNFAELYNRFKKEMRSQFGDLRYKATWERAWAKLDVALTWETLDDYGFLVRTFTQYAPREGWSHLIPLVLDELLLNERALYCIKRGFERIVQMSPDAEFTEERKLFHAIQEALARQESSGRRLPTAA